MDCKWAVKADDFHAGFYLPYVAPAAARTVLSGADRSFPPDTGVRLSGCRQARDDIEADAASRLHPGARVDFEAGRPRFSARPCRC